jgi:3-oxoacyl-[acyl-carrier protein] reductase
MNMRTSKQKKGVLAGRVALIAGGSRGIGLAIAERFAEEGGRIALCGRTEADLKRATARLTRKGYDVRFFVVDARKEADVKRTLQAIRKAFGRVDILVNNVGGVRQFGNFEAITGADWQEVFEENILSTVYFSQASLPLLKRAPQAAILNIASVAGKRPGNFNPHYGAMKAAMIHLNRYLANQWGKYDIRVNAIAPHTVQGGVWSRDVANKARMFNLSLADAEAAMIKDVSAPSPLGRVVQLSDVAETALFLVSPRVRAVTGVCLMVDAGVVNSLF